MPTGSASIQSISPVTTQSSSTRNRGIGSRASGSRDTGTFMKIMRVCRSWVCIDSTDN